MVDFKTVEVETDLLILGGGMAACGAAVEAAYWAKQHGLKVTLVDKAAVDRSGAVAMGLSAINQYVGLKDGQNTIKDYVDYVRNDLMGVTREDLVANIARHVDSTVHLFEKWGLPIWKDEKGAYVHEGRWQLMINGESYKVVVAEAAKNAIGKENIYERVFIVGPIMDGERCAGAYGFSVRENTFYVFKAKAVVTAMGGAVHVFKPRSSGEGQGRAWYPPWNAGASTFFTLKAGAEMTCQEVRFIPVRFKDAYGPVGAWFLLFKSRATNALGENYMETRKPELEKLAAVRARQAGPGQPSQLPDAARRDGGQGPDPHAHRGSDPEDRSGLRRRQGREEEAEGARVRGVGGLPRHDDLAGDPVGRHQHLPRGEALRDRRRRAVLHRLPLRRFRRLGVRSGGPGARGVLLGLREHVDRARPLLRRRRVRRLVAQVLLRLSRRGQDRRQVRDPLHRQREAPAAALDAARVEALKAETYRPFETFQQFKDATTQADVNPNYIRPKMFQMRLQKLMDEYAGGVTTQFTTSEALLKRGLELLAFLKEDSAKLGAADLHELMRCWENVHRMYQAEAHVRSIMFREETRWPGYYFRSDKPKMDETNWHCFVNCKLNPTTNEWEMTKKPIVHVFTKPGEHELLGG